MKTYYVSKPDDFMKAIAAATFPNYRGRKFRVSTSIPSRLNSYWDGGSRDTFRFYDMKSGKVLAVASNHPFFERDKPRELSQLPNGVILVMHSIFCGKDIGITFYANDSDVTKMLPEQSTDLSENEKTVLRYTSRYKNTYAGQTHVRFQEARRDTGITRDSWVSAQQSLIAKGLLRKNRSITPEGRNNI